MILALPGQGRALVKRVPQPVQIELRKLSSRGAHVCREIFAGILVVGLVAIVLGYGRLGRGPISLQSLVPTIEAAINGELSDVHVKIDDAILQRAPDGPGVLFRLRNIRLVDKDGSILAQAPFAAIGMSGSALLSGRIAPGSVDFIGPRLLLFYDDAQGLSLSFSRPAVAESEAPIRGSLPAEGVTDQAAVPPAPGTAIAKRRVESAPGGQVLDVTRTVAEVFERARSGNTSYLTRFGVKDALVVLNQNGAETSWQVPDFSIDLEHKNGRRSILVGQANFASSKGDWQLDFRAAQQVRKQSLGVTALIENLVPSGLAGNFSSLGILKALDMVVNGETTVELSNSGEFLSGEAKLDLEFGTDHATLGSRQPAAHRQGRAQCELSARKGTWSRSPRRRCAGAAARRPSAASSVPCGIMAWRTSWNFTLKADPAVLAIEEFGLTPMKVDEWQVAGSITPQDGRVTISRFVIRSGNASIELAGSVVDTPGAEEVRLAGVISPMSVDVLKRLWPKFLAGKARAWVLERVAGGEVQGGKFTVNLGPADIAKLGAGGELPAETVNVELES